MMSSGRRRSHVPTIGEQVRQRCCPAFHCGGRRSCRSKPSQHQGGQQSAARQPSQGQAAAIAGPPPAVCATVFPEHALSYAFSSALEIASFGRQTQISVSSEQISDGKALFDGPRISGQVNVSDANRTTFFAPPTASLVVQPSRAGADTVVLLFA